MREKLFFRCNVDQKKKKRARKLKYVKWERISE